MPVVSEAHRDQVRQRILGAAVEVFAEQGYGLASVDAICRRAGLSKGGLYTYFASKDELFIAACSLVFDERFAHITKLVPPDEAVADRIQKLLSGLVDYVATENHQFLRLWVESYLQASRLPALLQLKTTVHTRFGRMLADLIQQGQRDGVISTDADPQVVVAAVLALADGILLHSLVPGWKADPEQLMRMLTEPFAAVTTVQDPNQVRG